MHRAPVRGRQRGIVVLLYMVGMLAIIGMAGFALDLGLAFLTKTRLQNALDAAALDGAKTLILTGSTSQAETAAQAIFASNITGGATPTVSFSPTQSPFAAGGLNARYVKVEVAAWPVQTYLSRVLGLADSYDISGEAMAGPQYLGEPCGAPLGVCGDPASGDANCTDGNGCFGIPADEITLHDTAVGPGNYGLMDMGSGATDVAEGMAGGDSLCVASGATHDVEPGMKNNIVQATNTRFGLTVTGKYADPDKYPPDVVTTPGDYDDYQSQLASGAYTHPTGTPMRRTMVMPVVDCSSEEIAGKKPVTVLGHACMFLTKPVVALGPLAGAVSAQIIDQCLAEGGTPDPDSDSGAARILLFQSGSQS
jgi:hypothetical protein